MTMGRKERVREMMTMVMMMMMTSLQVEPKCGKQVHHGHSGPQTTILMAQLRMRLTRMVSHMSIQLEVHIVEIKANT